jgi:hypothetical protein
VKGIIPKPDLLIPSSFLCDLTPATDQLLQYFYDTPVAYVDNMVDEKGDRWPEEIRLRKVEYLGTEMRNCIDTFRQVLGKELTEEQIKASIRVYVKNVYSSMGFEEMRKADPLPISDNDMHLATGLQNVKRGLLEGPAVLELLKTELKKKVEDGVGVTKKNAPKVMLVMQPHDPSLVTLIYELGLSTGASSSPVERIQAQTPSYPDLWDRVSVAQLLGRGANYSSLAYINGMMDTVRASNVDGVIFFRHYSCRQYSIFPIKAKAMIEEELGIRVLLLEGDYCDFRSYNTQNMRTKLETFAEIVKAENAAKGRSKS